MTSVEEIRELILKQGNVFSACLSKSAERINELEKSIFDFQVKAGRPNVGFKSGFIGGQEEKASIAAYIRGETKSMSIGSGPDGGWTVNPVLENGIGTIVRQNSALRELVNFIPLESGDAHEEIISTTPVGAKWAGAAEPRPETDSPKLVKIITRLEEEYAEPVISQRLVDDSSYAMVDFLVGECGISFAESEELALFYGTGVNQPAGLDTITANTLGDDARKFGDIQYLPTGSAGDFSQTDPYDALHKVFYSLRAGYRKNAKWVCNSNTALALSRIKDGQGNYLWSEGNVKDGTPQTLLGKPVVICETTPSIGANAKALWFGDWGQAIRGIERPGNKVLLDPYSDKPNIVVYVYRRMGLQLRNSNALKCLKFSVS